LFQLSIVPYCVRGCFTPDKAQQCVALFASFAKPLSPATGMFPWDHPDVAGHRIAVGEPRRGSREHFGG
jgi:hypothetical protein